MRVLSTQLLIPIAAILMVILYWFRPGGIEGPRPAAVAPKGKTFDHGPFRTVLKDIIRGDGTIDYQKLTENPKPLDQYLGMIRAVSPASAPHRFRSNNDRLAYYLNAYNAFVLAGVRDHCPAATLKDLYAGNGFFWRISFLMGEQEISLSTLESERIRGVMQRNPIIHFALVKGAAGFMPLSNEPYQGDVLDAQLDALIQKVISSPHMVSRQGDELTLSALFEWYQHDFGDVANWLKRFAPKLAAGTTVIKYREFDWKLNGQCKTP